MYLLNYQVVESSEYPLIIYLDLDKGEIEKRVFWKEPIFADNVKIAHVMASKLPGYKMKAGRHDVLYQAADSDGNKARCVFTVTVWDNKYR